MILYRGTSNKVDFFTPIEITQKDKEKKGIKAEKGIWLATDKQIALIMGALGGKVSFRMNYDPQDRYIQFAETNWKEKLDLDEKVYLYTLNLSEKEVEVVNLSEVLGLNPIKVGLPDEFSVKEILAGIKTI